MRLSKAGQPDYKPAIRL